VIYVSKDQLDQVEYLIGQSIQGNHVLFDVATLRRVLGGAELEGEIDEQDAYAVEHHIERLILKPSLEEKRAYLEGLSAETYDLVVRTYFNIVENNLYESAQTRH
jgi:hypothetical protein